MCGSASGQVKKKKKKGKLVVYRRANAEALRQIFGDIFAGAK